MLGFWLEENKGNNSFDYDIRRKINGEAKIWINNIVYGDILRKFKLGEKVVLELFENGKIESFSGLKYFIFDEERKIFLVDNHNYILSAWLDSYIQTKYLKDKYQFVHIDQHADLGEVNIDFNGDNLIFEMFVNTNVGNYIKPMQKYGLIGKDIQIRTQYALKNFEPTEKFYLNIDLDFWVDGDLENIQKVKKLINQAEFIFIATSPYFIKQENVFDILKNFFKIKSC